MVRISITAPQGTITQSGQKPCHWMGSLVKMPTSQIAIMNTDTPSHDNHIARIPEPAFACRSVGVWCETAGGPGGGGGVAGRSDVSRVNSAMVTAA